jgi:gamma-glutamyl-gamma-aminobutyrate hydrolase PuuD
MDASAKCELPEGERLIIGCTYECGFFYKLRLNLASYSTGYPISIINMGELGETEQALSKVDAVLIPGGADIHPDFYLKEVSSDLKNYTEENIHLFEFSEEGQSRDPFEYSLVTAYSENNEFKDLPMLGICRGLQMMAVAQGAPLYLDIEKELAIANRRYLFDEIEIEEGSSQISSLYPEKKISGYKYHHQAIRMPNLKESPLFKVSATSHEGKIAEAIEYTHRPALGVQFHPEVSFPKASSPIFEWFFNKACEYKNSH